MITAALIILPLLLCVSIIFNVRHFRLYQKAMYYNKRLFVEVETKRDQLTALEQQKSGKNNVGVDTRNREVTE